MKIKRLCTILIQNYPQNPSYLFALFKAWKQEGVDTCVVDPNAANHRNWNELTMVSIPQSIQYAVRCQYDEIVFMTDEFMGPVFGLQELLQKSENYSGEVWQLTRNANMFGIRKSLYSSLGRANSLLQLKRICLEKKITILEFYNTQDLMEVTAYPLLDEPLLMVKKRRCPFFLHEVFHRNYSDVITTTLGHQGQVFYKWLRNGSEWDTNLLWDYLLANCHQQEYFENLHLTYILPSRGSNRKWVSDHLREESLALVMHLYYPDKLNESCSFAEHFPYETHVIITTSDEEKRKKILEMFPKERFASLDVRIVENRGRDVSALLIGAVEVFDKYTYICFYHDKKTLQTKPGSIGAGFAYRLQENLFATTDYVNNVIRLFYNNPRLGILSPPPPHHGDYFFTLGMDWGVNYELTKSLRDYLGFVAPIALDKMPIAPLGTCFWCRGKALKPLSDYNWQYSDFPSEPNSADGTILHAIERIYPFASVEAGYYPGFVLSDRYAGIEYSSMRHYVREYNLICIEHGIMNYQKDMCETLNSRLANC